MITQNARSADMTIRAYQRVTAVTEYDGRIGFRRDIYGRDARIFEALRMAGLALEATQG
jgi:murein L,D-transpeptidase YcbB/YkuD